uniref:Uncharacterized protein n=1 Tax=Physcomitrium patens TaxID=3218 RepID=A0A2K1J470_PHYPA|nr:hypothetical protein PHYPA_022169 [Physcomitrium patens]
MVAIGGENTVLQSFFLLLANLMLLLCLERIGRRLNLFFDNPTYVMIDKDDAVYLVKDEACKQKNIGFEFD